MRINEQLKKHLIMVKDGILYKRVFCKYSKEIIQKLVKERDFDNRFFEYIRFQYIKSTIPSLYKDTVDPELKECIEYTRDHEPRMFCYEGSEKNYYDSREVMFDDETKLYYGYWMKKKVFFKRSYTTAESVSRYLGNSLWEQSEESPHRYLTDEFDVSEGGTVLDIGGAEGNFSLSVIDRASKVYIIECDDEWVEALKSTFKEYGDRVEIIKKYVSDKNSDNTITIDAIIEKYCIEKVDMVKMDIEGAEIRAIKGAKRSIKTGKIAKWAVCTYHNPNDANKISKLLRSYKQEFSRGYIMSAVWRWRDLKYPFWVKGVLRAKEYK